jgi:uncharacterized membrane protein
MLILLLGLVLFFAPHLLREMGLRQTVKNALPSEAFYMGLYSLVALAGLGLIIWGKSMAPFQMVWEPIFEKRSISLMLMIPALVLVVAGNMPMSYLRKHLRNPMLIGMLLWGLSHLWSNGDLASILLFGSFTIWSAIKIISLHTLADKKTKSPSIIWDIISLLGGLTLYILIAIYHGQLFGIGISFF